MANEVSPRVRKQFTSVRNGRVGSGWRCPVCGPHLSSANSPLRRTFDASPPLASARRRISGSEPSLLRFAFWIRPKFVAVEPGPTFGRTASREWGTRGPGIQPGAGWRDPAGKRLFRSRLRKQPAWVTLWVVEGLTVWCQNRLSLFVCCWAWKPDGAVNASFWYSWFRLLWYMPRQKRKTTITKRRNKIIKITPYFIFYLKKRVIRVITGGKNGEE